MTTEILLDEIKELIPHREPFLFLDKLFNIKKLTSATGYKIFRHESFFQPTGSSFVAFVFDRIALLEFSEFVSQSPKDLPKLPQSPAERRSDRDSRDPQHGQSRTSGTCHVK